MFYPAGQSIRSWAAPCLATPPRWEALPYLHIREPAGPSCRIVDKQVPVTHKKLGRCLGVMVFVKTTKICWGRGKQQQLRNSAKHTSPCSGVINTSVEQVLWVQLAVPPNHWGKRACVRWLLTREEINWLFLKEKHVTSRTKGGLGWKGGKRVITLCYKTSVYSGVLISGACFSSLSLEDDLFTAFKRVFCLKVQDAYSDCYFVKTVQIRFFHKFSSGAFKEWPVASLMTWEVGTTFHAAVCGQKE